MKNVRNPVWIDKNKGILNCEVEIAGKWVAYAAHANDVVPLGPEIIRAAVRGDLGEVTEQLNTYSPQILTSVNMQKSQFLIKMLKYDLLGKEETIEAAQINRFPQTWMEELVQRNASEEHLTKAQISFSSDTSVNQYTTFVQVMIFYGIWNHNEITSILKDAV
jgi:hypothetical protein